MASPLFFCIACKLYRILSPPSPSPLGSEGEGGDEKLHFYLESIDETLGLYKSELGYTDEDLMHVMKINTSDYNSWFIKKLKMFVILYIFVYLCIQ